MDFTLSKEHEMARALFREFAENEVKPLAQEVDETEVFPRGTVEKMAKYGFLGIPVPKEYGGQGCDPLTYAMCYRVRTYIPLHRSDYDIWYRGAKTEICGTSCKRGEAGCFWLD